MPLLGQEFAHLRVKVIGRWSLAQVASVDAIALHMQEYFSRSWCMVDASKILHFGVVLARRIPLVRIPYRTVMTIIPPWSDREQRKRLIAAMRKLMKETKAPAIAWGGDATNKYGGHDGLSIYVQTGEDVRGYHAPTKTERGVRSVGEWRAKSTSPLPPPPATDMN